ncbi:hypothetical protein H8E77_09415 [bacterium]|nr:hypothetical protein [bacterium]
MWRIAGRSIVKLSFDVKSTFVGPRMEIMPIIRIMANMVLCLQDGGFTPLQQAIVDTGSYWSVVPQELWTACAVDIIEPNAPIIGFAPDEVCHIPASIGRISGKILDDEGHETRLLTFLAFLAHTDDVPLVLGFADILSEFQVRFDYRTRTAYLDERLL